MLHESKVKVDLAVKSSGQDHLIETLRKAVLLLRTQSRPDKGQNMCTQSSKPYLHRKY